MYLVLMTIDMTVVAMLVPGADDVAVAVLMAGSGELTPVEGEGGIGENPLVGQAEASSRDPGSVHPK